MTHSHPWERYADPLHVEAGKYIFEEGDPSDTMYVIQQGEVIIIKDAPGTEPTLLGYRGAGDLIGEISLLNDAPRTASALALEPATLLAIPRDAFWTLLRGNPDFQDTVIHTLIEALLNADRSRQETTKWEYGILERLSTLSGEREHLAELLQIRREMVQFVVHDLRSPLQVVSLAIDMLRLKSAETLNEDQLRYLRMSQGGVRRVLDLIDAILDVERMDEGFAHLDLEPVDLPALAAEVIDSHRPLAEAQSLHLVLEPCDPLPSVPADRARVERTLSNLVDNALKFTPPGGRIVVSLSCDDEECLVAVDDTGSGIPPDQREAVFERFVQSEEGQRTRGFGLGLTYARQAVIAHGGRIWIEDSSGGEGARFVFSLPFERPDASEHG